MIFDEVTSLDTRPSAKSRRASPRSRPAATLIIAHRPSTVVDADQILVPTWAASSSAATTTSCSRGGLYAVMRRASRNAREAEMEEAE